MSFFGKAKIPITFEPGKDARVQLAEMHLQHLREQLKRTAAEHPYRKNLEREIKYFEDGNLIPHDFIYVVDGEIVAGEPSEEDWRTKTVSSINPIIEQWSVWDR